MKLFLFALMAYSTVSLAVEATFNALATAVGSIRRKEPVDWHFPAKTSMWSIFVYGLSAAVSWCSIGAFIPGFFEWHWFFRGLFYMFGIYAWEFFWGCLIAWLTKKDPWPYTDSRWRIWRHIQPKYAVFWFGFGFLLEKIYLELLPLFL